MTDVDPANFVVSSGMNTAFNEWVPSAKTGEGVNVATLLAPTVAMPRLVLPSLNCTLPVAGLPIGSAGRLTVADRVSEVPWTVGDGGATFSVVMDPLGFEAGSVDW